MSTMQYISTRGSMDPIGFQDAVMTGLAPDGGLLIPAEIPHAASSLARWRSLAYQDLACEVMQPFVDLNHTELRELVATAYASFRHDDIAPLIQVGPVYVLELFHGPTLAFKDIALQFLGPLFSRILARTDRRLNILAATSGDTGSAAIHGVRGRERIRIFVMHPHNRISPLQEKQMTAVLDDNVFNLAVDGTFDDCQTIMKNIFRDMPFKMRFELGAVNSVNWARVLAQIVYYFYAAFRAMDKTGCREVQFAVPTGNFGDILAGYYALRMGLPVRRLILATNENDILSRFFNTGVYSLGQVVPTISPSMDIQVASNFERFLFYKAGCDSQRLNDWMNTFQQTRTLQVPLDADGVVDLAFVAGKGDTAETHVAIQRCYQEHGYILDPHTAVGVHVAQTYLCDETPTICLATAHPAKFNQAIRDAIGQDSRHELLDRLVDAETRMDVLPSDENAVRKYMERKIAGQ